MALRLEMFFDVSRGQLRLMVGELARFFECYLISQLFELFHEPLCPIISYDEVVLTR